MLCNCLFVWSNMVWSFSKSRRYTRWYTSANVEALKQNSAKPSQQKSIFPPLSPRGHVGAALSQNTVNMFIRCCFLVHYWFCRLCTLPSLNCIMLKISSTSFEVYQLNEFWLMCLSVCMWTGLLVISNHDISIYIIIWSILVHLWMCNDKMSLHKMRCVSYLRCETISTWC